MNKIIFSLFILSFSFFLSGHEKLALHYLEELYKNNPKLKSDSLAYAADNLLKDQISWADPILTSAFQPKSIETRLGSQQGKLGLMQSLPKFGELNKKREINNQKSKISLSNYEISKAQLRSDLLKKWYHIYFLKAKIDLQKGKVELLKWSLDLKIKDVENGSLSSDKYLESEVGLLRNQTMLQNQGENLKNQKIGFNILLNKSANSKILFPDSLEFKPDSAMFNFDKHTPILQKLNEMYKLNNYQIDLAEYSFQPKVVLGLEYIFIADDKYVMNNDGGKDAIALMANISLPIHRSSKSALIAEKRIRNKVITAKSKAVENNLEAKIVNLKFKFVTSENQLIFFDKRLNHLERIIKIKEAGLRAGAKALSLIALKIEKQELLSEILDFRNNLYQSFYTYLGLYSDL